MTDRGTYISGRYCVEDCRQYDPACETLIVTDSADGHCRRLMKLFSKSARSFRLENMIRFRSEIAIALRLEHPHILRTVDYGETDDRIYVVWEHVDCVTLDELVSTGRKIGGDACLEIVISLCGAIQRLHDNGIMFHMLCPGNVIVPLVNGEPSLKGIRIRDVGVSRLMADEKDHGFELNKWSSFCSPEYLGRATSSAQNRNDIYSLGMMLQYLLAVDQARHGDSLRDRASRGEIGLSAIRREPHGAVPAMIGKIIARMTDKDALKRYAQAASVARDLELYVRGYRDYALAEYDRELQGPFVTSLVGMEEELAQLKRMYNAAKKNNGGLCLISGAAGSGKSFLADEFARHVLEDGGLFLSRKLYESADPVPYAPLRDVLSLYVERFRSMPEWVKRDVSTRIKKDLRMFGEIICQFNGAMREIMGEYPRLIELDPDRELRRYLMALAGLFRVMGEIEKCLVVHLDNIDQIDEGSFALLMEMLQNSAGSRLMVVGTCRNDEIGGDHIFKKLSESGKTGQYNYGEIRIRPFTRDMMNLYIRALLSQEGPDVDLFAAIVHRKTRGNPYFSQVLIKDMARTEALTFLDNRWAFNFEMIENIQAPQGFHELIVKRAGLLSSRDRYIMALAAVKGKSIDLELLVKLVRSLRPSGDDCGNAVEEEIVAAVDRAMEAEILEEDAQSAGTFDFTDIRIRDHFYNFLGPDERRSAHGHLAGIMSRQATAENDSIYFDLSYHYGEAGDRTSLMQYAFLAGLFARANHSHDTALSYFETVIRCIEEIPDYRDDPAIMKKWISCKEDIGAIYLTIGEIDRAIELYNSILPYKDMPIEKAAICRQICFAYFKMGNWSMCEEYGKRALFLLGERLPMGKAAVIFGIVRNSALHLLYRITPFRFAGRRSAAARDRDRMKILIYVATNWMYILSNVTKFVGTIMRMLYISESRVGKSRELGMSLAAFASMCMAIPLYRMSLRYHHKALRMREELGDLWGQGQSYQWLAYCHSWMGNYSKSDEAFIKSLNIFQTIGDLWETGMNLGGIAYCHYMNSSYEKAIQYSREYKIISIKLADYYGLSRCYQYMALSLVEKGDFETAQDYLTEAMNICIEKKLDFNLCVNHICMGALHREQGDYDRALRYFIEARNLAHANSFISEYIVELYNGIAECSLRIAVRESRQAFAVTKKEIRSLKRACLTALRKTWSLPNHRGSALRNYAEFLSAINDFRKAGTLYRRSLAHLSAVGRKFEHARALYSYGLYLRRTGCDVESKKAFQDACDFFTEIGSAAHAAKAARLLGAGEGKDEEPQALFDHHRLASVVDLSQDISSILDLDELFDQIVKKAVGVTGAQRGFLFIKNREHDELELRVSISSLKSDDDGYSRHIVDHVCSSGQTLILTNAESDNRYSLYQSIMRNGLKSVLCLPIRSYETLIGICYLDNPLKRGVFSRQDALSLEIFMAQAGIAIENAHYYAELENRVRERTRELNAANEELGSAYGTVNDAFQIIKEDLAVAQSVQRSLLPHTVSISGLDCYIHYSSVSEIGGDIYDISEISPGRTRVFICDATGHGIQAALITMVIKNEYDAIKHVHSDPAEVLNELNRVICRNYKNLQIVFTCAVADLCLNERTVLFSCAGHPPQYLISGGRILSMEKTGRIIGLMEGSTYACEERTLDAGDRLLFFTDGLFEQFNGSRVAYGEKRLYEAVSRWADLPLEQLVRAVFEDIAAFLGQNNVPGQDDDITFIGIAFDRG